jgi:tight adherence protein B
MNPVLIIVVIAIVFTAILAVTQSVYWAYIVRSEARQRDLARRLGTLGDNPQESLFRQRAKDAAAQALGRLGIHLQEILDQADSELSVTALLGRVVLVGVGSTLVLGLFIGIPALIVGPILGLVPYFLMRRAGAKRARMLVEQLPDVLDLMARSLQAGLSLNDSFRSVAEEMPLPSAAEFGRAFEEIRFGREYREALGNLVKRNPQIFDLRLFVSSVLLQRETGGNLIEILENIATTIRSRFLFEAKVRALTSEARFSALILGGLPLMVALLLAIINPQYLTPLWTDSVGNFFLLFALVMYCIGIFLMQRLSQVEV